MQVVLGMDTVHSDMGSVLIILHTAGVRILQRSAREHIPPRHRRTIRFPHRHRCSFLRCLPRRPFLPHGLQSQPNRHS
ncbi:unnamed protein product, partial [Ilex paraguariensis]